MKYLKVWCDFRKAIQHLTPADKGYLFDAMMLYAETGEEPENLPERAFIMWPVAKRDVDHAIEESQKRSVNGSKGGRGNKADESNEKQDKANESNVKQTKAEESRKEKKGKETKGNETKPLSEVRFKPPTVDEVREYCLERRNAVNPERFVDFYSSKGWKVGNQPMKDWKACVRTWEQRDQGKKVIAQDFPQRDYSDVDQQMLADLAREMREARCVG